MPYHRKMTLALQYMKETSYILKGACDAVRRNECKTLGGTRFVLVEFSFMTGHPALC